MNPMFVYDQARRHTLVRFLCCMGLMVLAYAMWQAWFAAGYLQPIAFIAAGLLNLVGVETFFDGSSLAQGYCALAMERKLFHITFRCTGLFSLLIYWGAVAAYPATIRYRAWGIVVGGGAFFVYGALRIVALGLVAYWVPGWLEFCHIYLMVLFNLGFVLFLWATWINHSPLTETAAHR